LVTLIVEVNYSTQVDLMIAGNFRNDLRAYYLAKSGINIAMSYLKYDAENSDTDDLTEDWAKSYPPIPVDGGFVKVLIEDEDAKINVNKLVMGDGKLHPNIHTALSNIFESLEVDLEILDAIIDWIDPNDEGESENHYYGSLDPPYACKDGPLDTLSELLMVKGVTDEVYGKISKYLTIYSKDGKININTVGKEVLLCLDDEIDEAMAEGIVESREESPFVAKEELKPVINNDEVYIRIRPIIDVKSNAFSVTSVGRVERVEKTIRAVVNREGDRIACRYWRMQ
jgi:general secretion pathway protein K